MTGRRRLAITLTFAIVAGALALVLIPEPANAPRVESTKTDVGRFVPEHPDQIPTEERADEPLPGEQDELDPALRDLIPDDAGDPTVDENSTIVRIRLVDDATGKPLPRFEVRFGVLEWDGDQEASLYDVPPDEHDRNWVTATTDDEGVLALPLNARPGDLRRERFPLYPLPRGWLPATPPLELMRQVAAGLRQTRSDPFEVRIRRGLNLTVRCVHDDGTPVEGAEVRLQPHWDQPYVEAMFEESIWWANWPEVLEPGIIPPLNQEGPAGEGDAHYRFWTGFDDFDFPTPPPEWRGISDEFGVVELTGLPAGICRVGAFRRGSEEVLRELDLSTDSDIELTFDRQPDLQLKIHWHGDMEELRVIDIVAFGGELEIEPEGQSKLSVNLKGICPGRYFLNLLNNELPTPAVELQPGHNVKEIHLGPDSLATWHADLSVNGYALERFSLALRHVESPTINAPWGTFPRKEEVGVIEQVEFENGEPVRLLPGRYLVKTPEGEVVEFHFTPGEEKTTRFDVQVREVTFTITREFANWIGRTDGTSGLSIEDTCYIGDYRFDCLHDAVTSWNRPEQWSLDDLAPGHPVALPLPPAVYGVSLYTQWPSAIYPNQLDLSDPELTQVEFSMDGWPGVEAYHIQWSETANGEEVATWLVDDSIWWLEFSWFDDTRNIYTCFSPTRSFAGYLSVGDRLPRRRCWISKPGRYQPRADWGYGECSISLANPGPDAHCDGWVSWERNGIRFYADIDQDDPAKDLPPGPLEVRLSRWEWSEELDRSVGSFATLEVDLSHNHTIDLSTVRWSTGGRIRVLCPKGLENSTRYITGENASADVFSDRDAGDHLELSSVELPDGEYHVIAIIAGRSIDTHDARIQDGRDVVIDLR